MAIKVQWEEKARGLKSGELHSFVYSETVTDRGVIAVVLDDLGRFNLVPYYELKVVPNTNDNR